MDTQMAGYFTSLASIGGLKKTLQATQASLKWSIYTFASKNKQQKASINAIVTNPVF
jgi:hypothetical protein